MAGRRIVSQPVSQAVRQSGSQSVSQAEAKTKAALNFNRRQEKRKEISVKAVTAATFSC